MGWNGLYMQETPETYHSWKNSALRSGSNFPQTDVRLVDGVTEVISAKGGNISY